MTAQDHLAAGQSALAAGRWQEARTAFTAALAGARAIACATRQAADPE